MEELIRRKTEEEIGTEPEEIIHYEENGDWIYKVNVSDDEGFEVVLTPGSDDELKREIVEYQVEVLSQYYMQ